jgi:hypothetical protein
VRKEVDFCANIEEAEDNNKKDARPVEPLPHAVSLTKLRFSGTRQF